MKQLKIGKFIAKCRKMKNMTQALLELKVAITLIINKKNWKNFQYVYILKVFLIL